MPMTNFPQGFANGLSVRGLPLLQMQPGNVYWVDNSGLNGVGDTKTVAGSDKNPGTFQRPFASLYYAISRCQQGRGDVVFVKPGHVETVTGLSTVTKTTNGDSAVLNFNCAGVAIVGLGAGLLRPKLNFTTANTAMIPLRGSGMSIQNFQFTANFLSIASVFTAPACSAATSTIAGTVLTAGAITGALYPGMALMGTGVAPGTIVTAQLTGAAAATGTYSVNISQTVASTTITAGVHDFSVENCEFRDMSTVLSFLAAVSGSATANSLDGLRFVNNKVFSLGTTAAASSAVKLTAAADRACLADNLVVSDAASTGPGLLTSNAALTNVEVMRNSVFKPTTAGTPLLMVASAGTGMVAYNNCWTVGGTAGLVITASTGYGMVQNFGTITGAANKSAIINPVYA